MPETLTELLHRQRREFEAAGVESPALSAELLLAEALGLERSALLHKLILEPDAVISAAEKLQALCARRLQGEPVAYILGRKEFYGREFLVNRHTLIPRPETELIIDYALDWAKQRTQSKKCDAYAPAAEHKFKATPLTPDKKNDLGHFADLGTGSGCLAVTLALELPGWPGLAMDISEPALKLARENARRLGVAIEQDTPEQRDTLNALNETGTIKKSDAPALSAVSGSLTFLAADFTRFRFAPGSLDLLVSNPPYVSEGEYAGLDKGVRDFEPHSALVPTLSTLPASLHPSQTDTMRPITQVAPVNEFQENAPPGTQLLAPLCALAAQALKPGGLFLMEIGCAQGDYVRSLLAQSPAWSKAVVLPDLAGLNRLAWAIHI